jgi:hypothetical protein
LLPAPKRALRPGFLRTPADENFEWKRQFFLWAIAAYSTPLFMLDYTAPGAKKQEECKTRAQVF